MGNDETAGMAPSIEILVTAGEVTLRGTVQDERQRAAIARTAQQFAGLTQVINHLEVVHR